MTTLTSQSTRLIQPNRPTIALRQLLRGGAVAAVAGIAMAEVCAALAKAAGVSLRAGFLGASHASALSASSFATGVLVCTFWGTVLAGVLARTSTRPVQRFVMVSTALTALSLVVPFGAGATAASTKATLAATHILVADVVIPILAHGLRHGVALTKTGSGDAEAGGEAAIRASRKNFFGRA